MTDTQLPPGARALSAPVRWLLQGLAGLCLVLAVVGIVLPVMPTVPFLVVAAWAAARSSPRLHRWLLTHRRFGPYLRDWNEAGVVPRRAKWFSTAMMGGSAASMPVFVPAEWALVVVVPVAGMAAVLVWLWKRPEQRPQD
ncbi:YbaN family protein [Ramlibacter sp. USB13]|uniref:YbaN family protein n=1 Tax=Ramlibacter cellulosilyticus TaxID=2764187 RepID=A0A923MW94_9BURK|nr:YbaN family protein [Ramlibacter cellulosilyticus]